MGKIKIGILFGISVLFIYSSVAKYIKHKEEQQNQQCINTVIDAVQKEYKILSVSSQDAIYKFLVVFCRQHNNNSDIVIKEILR